MCANWPRHLGSLKTNKRKPEHDIKIKDKIQAVFRGRPKDE